MTEGSITTLEHRIIKLLQHIYIENLKSATQTLQKHFGNLNLIDYTSLNTVFSMLYN